MKTKQLKEQIRLRYSANAYENLSDRERKLYRVGFKTGYKLAREYFRTNTIIKQNTDLDSIYELDLDIYKRNTIQVHYQNKSPHSHLKIKKIMFNNIELHHLDTFSTYHTNGKVKKTYGWMDEIGTYNINIHGNPVSHQLLTFLISKK